MVPVRRSGFKGWRRPLCLAVGYTPYCAGRKRLEGCNHQKSLPTARTLVQHDHLFIQGAGEEEPCAQEEEQQGTVSE